MRDSWHTERLTCSPRLNTLDAQAPELDVQRGERSHGNPTVRAALHAVGLYTHVAPASRLRTPRCYYSALTDQGVRDYSSGRVPA